MVYTWGFFVYCPVGTAGQTGYHNRLVPQVSQNNTTGRYRRSDRWAKKN